MPYKRSGRVIMVKSAKGWHKKAKAKSVASAKRMLNLLRAMKHGWKPSKRK